MKKDLIDLLAFCIKQNASDLHLAPDLPPLIRVDGDIRRLNMDPLTSESVQALLYDVMNDRQRKEYEEFLEADFSFEVPNLARFRVNILNQRGGVGGVFRVVPSEVPTLEGLDCPDVFKGIACYPRGLVLVTGPTGSGKSTTMAAMINYKNENEHAHNLTIEDPIEFVHRSKKSLVRQREVFRHTHGFTEALRSALREDPDVILVGELRDLETIRLALTAAETGHLVFGTLHTSSAAKTINRIVDVFPAGEKETTRTMLSESLQAVISQVLVKRVDGGRVAAHEVMIGTQAVRSLIREDRVPQLYGMIQAGRKFGMITLDQSLKDLVERGQFGARCTHGGADGRHLVVGSGTVASMQPPNGCWDGTEER